MVAPVRPRMVSTGDGSARGGERRGPGGACRPGLGTQPPGGGLCLGFLTDTAPTPRGQRHHPDGRRSQSQGGFSRARPRPLPPPCGRLPPTLLPSE